MKGKAGTFTVLVLLALAATGVRGDAACTNGQVTGGTAGQAGTTCECNQGYAGGGPIAGGTYTDCDPCATGKFNDQGYFGTRCQSQTILS